MAITAVARKLVTIAFLMLKNNEPYRYARPELMREKLSKLKLLPKRPAAKPGSPKPGLADIYRDAKLSRAWVPNQLPKGEARMLEEHELRQFVQDLYSTVCANFGQAIGEAGPPRGAAQVIFVLAMPDSWPLAR